MGSLKNESPGNMEGPGGMLAKAGGLAEKILALSSSLRFSGTADSEQKDVEAYAELMEAREPLVAELMEIRKGLTPEAVKTPEFMAIKATIDKINALDKKHLEFVQQMRNNVLKAHREVKDGQRVYDGYSSAPPDTGSVRFDIKQ